MGVIDWHVANTLAKSAAKKDSPAKNIKKTASAIPQKLPKTPQKKNLPSGTAGKTPHLSILLKILSSTIIATIGKKTKMSTIPIGLYPLPPGGWFVSIRIHLPRPVYKG